MLLVTGTPRSGTSYLTHLLNQYKLNLGHERVGPGGTVSGFFFIDHDWYPYGHNKTSEKPGDFDFRVLIRLVRHPLKTIPSLAALIERQYISANNNYKLWYPEVGIETDKNNLIWSALNVWVKTHQTIQNEDLTIRLETIEEQWSDIQKLLDIPDPYKPIPVPNVSFKKPPTTWKVLSKLDKDLTKQAIELTKGFDYGVEL